ncbi:MAG: DNA-binding protein Alba [Candidatus Baldrarchaeia archaeon]
MSEEAPTENVVFVGKKPLSSYILAAITQLNEGAKRIVLKARGRAISRAVDIAEILRKRLGFNLEVKDIKTGTETLTTPDGKQINVSAIEIVLERQ